MGTRTILEFNHDRAHDIERDPEGFMQALNYYLNSASQKNMERLERYGIRRVWWGSSYDQRKLVTPFGETKL